MREIKETQLPESQVAVWYLGQMGTVVKWKQTVVGIDLVLNDLYTAEGTSRRNYGIPFAPEDFHLLDCLIGTHNHKDHINTDTILPLVQANPDLKVIVPYPECGELLEKGVPELNLVGAKAEEPVTLGEGVVIHPVAAAHEEYITDEFGNQRNLGYILKCGTLHVYHSGDTVVTLKLIEDVKAQRPIHVACIPINGVDTERHSRGIIGNMDCRDAAYFASQIEADMTIPMHYDMVMGNEENPLIFADYMRELYPGRKYHQMQLGERFIYA